MNPTSQNFPTSQNSPSSQQLLLAEQKAMQLFDAVEARQLIVPGKSEAALVSEIALLAAQSFGIDNYWHKKIVRTGPNTLCPYNDDPADRVIDPDDILFLDFGPIVDGWEADLGRTIVLGDDPRKRKLRDDVEAAWHKANAWIGSQKQLTGAECFQYVTDLAKTYGWEFGGEIAGHIVGPYPHEQLAPGDWGLDIHPDNHSDILAPVGDAPIRSWILEIHFIDREHQIGAFCERLLQPSYFPGA